MDTLFDLPTLWAFVIAFAVFAYVVPASGAALDPDAILAEAATALARFKLPRRIEVVDTLPHTVTGKVMKWRLRPARSADASG